MTHKQIQTVSLAPPDFLDVQGSQIGLSVARKAVATTEHLDRNSIIRLSRLLTLLGISRSTAYALMSPHSGYFDSNFPKRIRLSQRAVGWRLGDVLTYIENLQRQ